MLAHRTSLLYGALSAFCAFLILALHGAGPVPVVALVLLSTVFFGLSARSVSLTRDRLAPHAALLPRRFAAESFTNPEGGSLALLFVEVDGLEPDRRALQLVAHAVESVARPEDIVVRWGEDELAILAPGTGRAEAFALANRLQRAVETLSECLVTVSIGVAATERFGRILPSSLVDAADEALEHARRAGSNRSVLSVAAVGRG